MQLKVRYLFAFVFLFAILSMPIVGLAEGQDGSLDGNPFLEMDSDREKIISGAKDSDRRGLSSEGGMSAEEMVQKEKELLESPGERYIVKFNEDASMQQIYGVVSQYKYKLLGYSEDRRFMVKIANMEEFEKKAEGMLEYVEADRKMQTQAIPSDTYYSEQWALSAINLPEAWDITTGSNSVYVAVIDSGIYRDQPDLAEADIRNGWDYIFGEYCEWDSTGHGTNVTGVIGAQTDNAQGVAGVNWDVAIIPLRVEWSDGTIYTTDVYQAIIDAADMGCDVINLSLGGAYYDADVDSAVQYAISRGSIVVASAGNDGTTSYNYPASYDGVISAGSVGSNLVRSWFSQYNNKLDVVAPGEGILTTEDWLKNDYGYDYVFVDGTSFSAPYVSGVAALASACKPSINASEFTNALKAASIDLGSSGFDNYYGYGLLDAKRTLEYLLEPEAPSGLNVKSYGATSVSLGWSANQEFDLAGYQLEYKAKTASVWTSVSVGKLQTSYTVSSLTGGKAYDFRIKAKDSAGNWSGYSNVVSATPEIIGVEGVAVSPTNMVIDKGSTANLTAVVSPENAANKSVTWSSSNRKVAVVNSSGTVTGVGAGMATITATTSDGAFKASCMVIVEIPSKANVPLYKAWTVEFSMQPDMSTVSSETIYITDSIGNNVECSRVQGEIPNTVILNPIAGYNPNETYTVHVTQGILSLDGGVELSQPALMRFTTAQ